MVRLHSWPHTRLSERALPPLIHPPRPSFCIACAFSLSRMGKKLGSHRFTAHELYLFMRVFFLVLPSDRYGFFYFRALFIETLALWTRYNVRAVKHSASWRLFFMHLFPCLSGSTGCGCLGIIIIISGRQFELKAEPWLLHSSRFQLGLYLREEGETRASQGAYLSLKSHRRASAMWSLYHQARSSECIDVIELL